MSNRQIISSHFLIRWLERIDGMDLAVFRRAAERMGVKIETDHDLVGFMETYSSVDIDRIRDDVGPLVAKAMRSGATTIRYRGNRIPLRIFGRTGAAATVLPRRTSKLARRSRDLSTRVVQRRIEERGTSDDAYPYDTTGA
jgi:hypothetical protein